MDFSAANPSLYRLFRILISAFGEIYFVPVLAAHGGKLRLVDLVNEPEFDK
jgi:hypothetical protein